MGTYLREVFMLLRLTILLCAVGVFAQEEQKKEAAPTKADTLKVVTYNVLAEKVNTKQRVPALFKILKDANADIIVLQEVSPWLLFEMLDEPSLKDYALFEGYGEYLFIANVKADITRHEKLPGRQNRSVFFAQFTINGRKVAIATAHMESPLEAGPTRAKQLDQIFGLLKDCDDAILLGDFNFGDGEEPETSHLDKKYVDAWRAVKPNDPGYTWNIEKSDMAKNGSFPGEKSRRIDRILVRSDRWKPVAAEIIGDKPLNEGKQDAFPSDHFGLTATLKFSEPDKK